MVCVRVLLRVWMWRAAGAKCAPLLHGTALVPETLASLPGGQSHPCLTSFRPCLQACWLNRNQLALLAAAGL